MKGNFPLLSLIKAIFLSLQGYSFNEVSSSLLHLMHQLHGCTTQTLSKQLAQRSAWFTERRCPWRPKRHVCPEVHSVDHIQTKWECLGRYCQHAGDQAPSPSLMSFSFLGDLLIWKDNFPSLDSRLKEIKVILKKSKQGCSDWTQIPVGQAV